MARLAARVLIHEGVYGEDVSVAFDHGTRLLDPTGAQMRKGDRVRAVQPLALGLALVFAAGACRVGVCPGANGAAATFCTRNGSIELAGMNYTQVKQLSFEYPNFSKNDVVHATLMTGLYDPARLETALTQMAADGYSFIRVFISYDGEGYVRDANGNVLGGPFYGIAGPYTIGANHVNGLYKPYLDNFMDLLRRARHHGLYVQPTFEWLPENAYYELPASAYPNDPNGAPYVAGVNLFYLAQPWIEKKKAYVSAFLTYVKSVDPSLLTTIVAIDLQNEIFVDTSIPPFTRSDVVPLADGLSYDMSKDVDRQQAVDANFVHWSNDLVGAGHGVDPDALFGASVFTFNAIGLAGPNGVHSNTQIRETRYPARPWSLATYSLLAYTDIHSYVAASPDGHPYDPVWDVGTSEFSMIPTSQKPLWLGEFGTFRSIYANAAAAAPVVKAHKNTLVGLGFRAWGFWSWDISQGSTFSTFDAVESGGVIDAALNPTKNGF